MTIADRLQRTRSLPPRRTSRRPHRRPAQRRRRRRDRHDPQRSRQLVRPRPGRHPGLAPALGAAAPAGVHRRARRHARGRPRTHVAACRARRSPTAPYASPRASTTRRTATASPLGWSRNWASLAVLPPARDAGRLYYRFRVSSRLVLDGQASLSLVSTSVNFGIVRRCREGEPVRRRRLRDADRRARSWACSAAQTRMPRRRRSSRARSPCARATPRRWRSSSAPTCCSKTAGCACTRVRAPGSAPTEPGASGTIEFRYAPAAILRLMGRLDEPHGGRRRTPVAERRTALSEPGPDAEDAPPG